MSKYFAGIRPTAAAYGEYIIKPAFSENDNIKCVVPSVKGYISVTETKTDSSFTIDAHLPKSATALIYLPYKDGQTVKLNGQVIGQNNSFTQTDGITLVEAQNGFAVFKLTPADNTHFCFTAEN